MRSLFLFLYNYRAFFTFLFLEGICVFLIVKNNKFQGAEFFNSSNETSATLLTFSNDISAYFRLKEVNEELAAENAALKKSLEIYHQSGSLPTPFKETRPSIINQYNFKMARVINNSTRRANNFLTINKGLKDGIKPGMGVVGSRGVIGSVKVCSENFSTVTSLLHSEIMISSQIKKSNAFGQVKWGGKNPKQANMLYVPKHIKVQKGDTVVTSGFNAVYPEGFMVGIVQEAKLYSKEIYWEIVIDLATDFNRISYVYVIENKLRKELDSLETKTPGSLYE
jgi:rod shape-determining protein MreC